MTSYSPCEWPLAEPSEACNAKALDALSPTDQELMTGMAVELLWSWTGRKFGTCEVSVRPCRQECFRQTSTFSGRSGAPAGGGHGWMPFVYEGQWFNLACGACGLQGCVCEPGASIAITLPGPVAGIESIWVDGELLEESAYRLTDDVLYRVDGGAWPMCNDQTGDLEDPDSGAWEITYLRGYEVPYGGQIAALKLADELAKAYCNDSSCELPSRVQSITRQGVSMEITQTDFQEMREGKTGIWIIDSWVASTQAPEDSRPGVFSPDILPGRNRGTMQGLGYGRTR